MLPLLHYVDDYFCADRSRSTPCTMDCLARLVRACLGESAISDRKLEHGFALTVLGVDIRVGLSSVLMWPSAEKSQKWCEQINSALSKGILTGGEASKLAGKLQWACSSAFKGNGRAMLRFACVIHESSGFIYISVIQAHHRADKGEVISH